MYDVKKRVGEKVRSQEGKNKMRRKEEEKKGKGIKVCNAKK